MKRRTVLQAIGAAAVFPFGLIGSTTKQDARFFSNHSGKAVSIRGCKELQVFEGEYFTLTINPSCNAKKWASLVYGCYKNKSGLRQHVLEEVSKVALNKGLISQESKNEAYPLKCLQVNANVSYIHDRREGQKIDENVNINIDRVYSFTNPRLQYCALSQGLVSVTIYFDDFEII